MALGPAQAKSFAERVIGDAIDSTDLGAFRRAVLRQLECLLGADTASAIPAPPLLDPRGATVSGLDPMALEHFLQNRARYYRSMDPVVRAMNGRGGPVIDVDVLPRSVRERLDFYVEVAVPARITSIMAGVLSFAGRSSAIICLNRHGRHDSFEFEDTCRFRRALSVFAVAEAAVAARVAASTGTGLSVLSRREYQVAQLIRAGLCNKEIVTLLGTSADTVRKQTIHLYEKLGIAGRVELVARYGESLANERQKATHAPDRDIHVLGRASAAPNGPSAYQSSSVSAVKRTSRFVK